MSVYSIDSEIKSNEKKIEELNNFLSKTAKLIENANTASKNLRLSGDNLARGLSIGGKSADQGKLQETADKIDNNVRKISSSIDVANSEIRACNSRINVLKREKERLIEEETKKKKEE